MSWRVFGAASIHSSARGGTTPVIVTRSRAISEKAVSGFGLGHMTTLPPA